MSDHSLEAVLRRLRDSHDPEAELDRARSLAAADARIPDELREALFRSAASAAEDAEGLLAVLGAEPLVDAALREVFAAGHGEADVSWDSGAWNGRPGSGDGWDDGWDVVAAGIGAAVRAEAGVADVADAVAAAVPAVAEEFDGELLRAAVAEGGAPDLSGAVAGALELPVWPVGEAVRAEAGVVDVAAGVLASIGAWQTEASAAGVPVRAANAGDGPSVFGFAGFGMAAAVLLAVVMGRLATPLLGSSEPEGFVFAKSGEVVVEELSTGSDVVVMQLEGDGGAVILWIDEEV